MNELTAKRTCIIIGVVAFSVLVMLTVSAALAQPKPAPITVQSIIALHKSGAMFRVAPDADDMSTPGKIERYNKRVTWMTLAAVGRDFVVFTDGSDGAGWTLAELQGGAIEYSLNPPSGSVKVLGR